MLKDSPVSSVSGDTPRKWISDDYFDLIIWYRDQTVTGFQLCYGKPYAEWALTWQEGDRYSHCQIDSGDDEATSNRTPILITGGTFPKDKIISEFTIQAKELPVEIQNLVLSKLHKYKA